ncbi:RNA 3'-phosphate cyclase, partial [Candidatus Sumerlaeota bacterium]|nr:RNA 3'-phosphate cyclase [Candidatus Sumerlaeota bacterium]
PCRIINIRARRRNPGLQEQHLQAVRATAMFSGAELSGAERGSQVLEFIPRQKTASEINITIGTAGSVGLVLQALSIAAMKDGAKIRISGGATFGKWAVPITYLEEVLLPIMRPYGYRAHLSIERYGFYPRGGARVNVRFFPWQATQPLRLIEQGKLKKITLLSFASNHLRQARVAERQTDSAKKILKKHFSTSIEERIKYVDALNPGSAIVVVAGTSHSRIGADALGERGKPAEKVGSEAAEILLREWDSGAPLDSHAGDQILPFLALSGGTVKVAKLTEHCLTNIFVIEQFLPVRFTVTETTITCVTRQ